MSTAKVKYLRTIIAYKKWYATERGERVMCTIGAIWAFLAFLSAFLLLVGILEPSMGLNRAITLVISLYVVLLGCSVIIKSEE